MCQPVASCSIDMDLGCHGGGEALGGCGSEGPGTSSGVYWDVEKILRKGNIGGITHYRVKWVNKSYVNMWVPLKNFRDPQMVTAFEEKEEKKKLKRMVKKGKLSPKPAARNRRVGSRSTPTKGKASPKSSTNKGKVTPTSSAERRSVKTRTPTKKDEVAPVSVAREKVIPSTAGNKTASVPPPPRDVAPAPDEPEKVIYANAEDGVLQYVVKYKGQKEYRVVPADVLHAESPQVALAFHVKEFHLRASAN